MAILTNDMPTLASAAALFTGEGKSKVIAELIEQTNPELSSIPMIEANSNIGLQVSARQSLPEIFRRRINQGIRPTASGYGAVTESAGIYTGLGQIDKALVDISTDKQKLRMTENKGHIMAMGQGFMSDLFYGDSNVNAESFMGLAPRFATLGTTNRADVQVLDAGGTGSDLCSVWLVGWGEGSVSGFYPQGSEAGISHNAEDLVTCHDRDKNQFLGYKDWFELKAGIGVWDYRQIVRIANIPWKLLEAGDPATGLPAGVPALVNLFTLALEMLNTTSGVSPAFYVPRTVSAFLRLQIQNKANVFLSDREVAGRKVTHFDNVPVYRTDALLLNETQVE